jgi:hypothetical protein
VRILGNVLRGGGSKIEISLFDLTTMAIAAILLHNIAQALAVCMEGSRLEEKEAGTSNEKLPASASVMSRLNHTYRISVPEKGLKVNLS